VSVRAVVCACTCGRPVRARAEHGTERYVDEYLRNSERISIDGVFARAVVVYGGRGALGATVVRKYKSLNFVRVSKC
jgi:hypothetical protein